LHRANGGHLVIDAHALMAEPGGYERLKRVLRAGETHLGTGVGLEPEPLALDIKVVLVGERWLYYMLRDSDPELDEHFKILADFEDDTERSEANVLTYARRLGAVIAREGLPPFSRTAVARVVEESSRWADDAERLSLDVRRASDLLVEAAHLSRIAGRARVHGEDVEAALAGRERRHGRLKSYALRFIEQGVHRIEASGARVGQINGLGVESYGTEEMGVPIRITARVRAGRGTVVDIEREVDLSGPLHSKGVLILGGFLGGRYATRRPLSLHATLVMEQSYGSIDGDSASLAELCALLSALSDLPIRQDLAVTGSVDQLGQVQAVGGVNAKIEGFFDVCRAFGDLAGHGVIIPESCVRHLMLRNDIVEAAREGAFNVYPVATVNEAMAILSGVPAGERNMYGNFQEDTVNARVESRLLALAATELSHDG
ncbi:MAG: AAA family ATPase, partial [Polyangiaceae bacterium]|nr:AAA family ATPase [Polyangiaceae bacterium]